MAPSPLFTLKPRGTTLVVVPQHNIGSLADENVPEELEHLVSVLEQQGIRDLIVDFANVQYFGSSMLEALRHLWVHVHAQQGSMILCNVSPTAAEVLRLARFDTLWPIVESQPEAIELTRRH